MLESTSIPWIFIPILLLLVCCDVLLSISEHISQNAMEFSVYLQEMINFFHSHRCLSTTQSDSDGGWKLFRNYHACKMPNMVPRYRHFARSILQPFENGSEKITAKTSSALTSLQLERRRETSKVYFHIIFPRKSFVWRPSSLYIEKKTQFAVGWFSQ